MSRVSEWVLATPRRLFLTVAAVVLAVIVAVVALATPDAPSQAAPDLERHSDAPSSIAPSTGAPTAPPGDDHRGRAGAHREALRVTRAYLAAFLDRTSSDRAWRARVDALSTSTLRQLNHTVPRAAVPSATVRRVTVRAASYSYAALSAALSDGTELSVALVLTGTGWRVTSVDPVTATGRAAG